MCKVEKFVLNKIVCASIPSAIIYNVIPCSTISEYFVQILNLISVFFPRLYYVLVIVSVLKFVYFYVSLRPHSNINMGGGNAGKLSLSSSLFHLIFVSSFLLAINLFNFFYILQ